ncbi:Thioredoxin domain-containing protein 5 [Termitomyces sp. J132]|nr:hypothetical protein H2248_005887 [Termitomyces sp. 'cryptogamus']KNZ73656.1 Thioredoxin domain-containing protein 5 [Termitomyces sp. J132]
MRSLQLPLSLLLLAVASNPVPVHSHSALLTPDTFPISGLWFIEFFSPYCPHCRNFAPTWDQLVTEAERDSPAVNLAQVDCSVHGDLCTEHHVMGYPSLYMYNNGEKLDAFSGDRDLPALHKFINKYAPPPPPQPNTKGDVLSLTPQSFASTLAQGPMFVKFFAPWCGHCKKLAPVWKQLAHAMKGKLNIVQVNCDDHSAICKAHNVQGYPTLVYISSGGIRSEYNGGRKLDELRNFAEKAASAGLHRIQSTELDTLVAQHEVMYVLVHSDNAILDTVAPAAAVLLGSPSVYTLSDPALLARFDIPQESTWALLAFKDHDPHVPTAILHERAVPASTPQDAIRTWFLEQRLPTTLELTQDTFQGVMNAPHAPLVVIAAVTSENSAEVARHMKDTGRKWRLRTKGSGLASGREVVWTWMDAEKWKNWMKSMYGIVVKEEDDDLDDVPVVVADHQRLVYYDRDSHNHRLEVSSSKSLFETVEAAAVGKLSYKHSENLVERVARYLNTKMVSLETYVVTYPWRAATFLCMIFLGIFFVLKRWLADDGDYRKVDRLD